MANYVYGTSAVRETIEAEPRRRQQEQPRPARRVHSHAKQSTVDLPYVIIMGIAGIVALLICINYLRVQSSVTTSLKNIEAYESRLEALKTENDALESNINTSINMDHIYTVATQELGMVYAHKDQIINYDRTESEYVRQYGDIPQ